MSRLDRLRESIPIEVEDDWGRTPAGIEAFRAIRAVTRTDEVLALDDAAARRRPWVYLLAGFASALAIAIPGTLLLTSGGGPGPLSPPQIPSARVVDEILEDGIVTDLELTTAAEAVITCVRENGGDRDREAEFDIDVDGTVTFTMIEADSAVFERCELTIHDGISRVWARQNQTPRAEGFYFYGSAVACTEQRSGSDFGEMTRDQLGFVSTVGQRTINEAIAQEPDLYDSCLTAMFDQVAIYNQVLQCVSARSGASLGRIEGRESSGKRAFSQINEEGFAVLGYALGQFPVEFERCLGDITAQASLESEK